MINVAWLLAPLLSLVFESSASSNDVCDPAPIPYRVLDLEFTASLEEWVAETTPVTVPERYLTLIERLDAERYADRAKAGASLSAICGADPAGERWLIRSRAHERRPETRYWLNRILRQLNRCETCGGAGYCPEYRPVPSEQPTYVGTACRRCGRFEWQHGWQWIEGSRYGYLACDECLGFGTHWIHYAVD
jgi:hypothetical protein